MITLNEAKQLRVGEILFDQWGKRWKVTSVKTWKTMPNRVRVGLKHGMYSYDVITDTLFDRNDECNLLSKGGE